MNILTAEDVLVKRFPYANQLDWFIPIQECMKDYTKQYIELCAERAEAYPHSLSTDYKGNKTGIVNKESILQIKNELK